MKRLNFNKGFVPCAVLSILVIVFGIAGFVTKGINFGIDFKPGLIEEVRVAPPVAEVTYNGSAKIAMELSAGQLDLVISGLPLEFHLVFLLFLIVLLVSFLLILQFFLNHFH